MQVLHLFRAVSVIDASGIPPSNGLFVFQAGSVFVVKPGLTAFRLIRLSLNENSFDLCCLLKRRTVCDDQVRLLADRECSRSIAQAEDFR